MDEKKLDTEWKWNIVSEEMEKSFETFQTVSNERLIKAGPKIWTVLRPLYKMQNEKLRLNKEDKDTSTTHWKDLDLDIYSEKHRISDGKPKCYREIFLNSSNS